MEVLHQSGDIIAHRYRILNTLGQGGSGTTYQVEGLESGEKVALKALSLHRMSDWKMMELFEREAKILSQLNHQAIPRYLEYFYVDTLGDRTFYIAQQLASGKSLAALVETSWHTSENEVRQIAIQVLKILIYLHSFTPPVVHRDIKPQNIIRDDDGRVFLVDFGAVQQTYYNTFMRGSTVVGTYGYMAPEQFRGQAVPVTDLYGLGATLLFLLTHRSPADLPTDGLKMNFRSRVQISEEFADWLEKMLEPDVEDRFSSAQEALQVLQAKQKITVKSPASRQWKTIVAMGMTVTGAVAAVAAVTLLNFYKWVVLDNIGFVDIAGKTPMHLAAQYGNQEGIEMLLAKGADVNAKDKNGSTPLHLADNQDIVQLLLAKGADVNAKDTYDSTPLHLADNKDVVKLLLAKGADVNAKDTDGSTPLHLADNKDVVKLLLAKGADVNAKDTYGGRTPLHLAVAKDTVQHLLAKGAEVNAKDIYDGRTPLHLADNQDVVKLLLAKGADVSAKDQNGRTPLHLAVAKDTYIVQLLLAKGVDVNAKDKGGSTPLHLADNKDVVKLLLAKGADVSAKDKDGSTPLHLAVAKDTDIVQLLLAKGADVNAKDEDGSTPLHLADNQDVVKLLLAKGADVNAKDKGGKTPSERREEREKQRQE